MATNSSFTALPDDVLQRVLVGVALDDHDATAAACRAFCDIIRGPQFPALREAVLPAQAQEPRATNHVTKDPTRGGRRVVIVEGDAQQHALQDVVG